MPRDSHQVLFDLAEKQDKFEHEYSSELVTRIGLFLVFAGFISAVAFDLVKLVLDTGTIKGTPWYAGAALLALSIVLLFSTMVLLLRAALLPGYSTPANVNQYRKRYKELIEHHEGDSESAHHDLREWILDATAEAVDVNSSKNERRANSIMRASRLLLASIISLFLALASITVPRLLMSQNEGTPAAQASVTDKPSPEVSNVEKEKGEKKRQEETGTAPE